MNTCIHLLCRMEIIEYTSDLKSHIKTLNVEWLEKYFHVEPNDEVQLSDPENEIIAKGGLIYYLRDGSEIIGTVSLLKLNDNVYELGKMAVTGNQQGKGAGKMLVEFSISKARSLGAATL